MHGTDHVAALCGDRDAHATTRCSTCCPWSTHRPMISLSVRATPGPFCGSAICLMPTAVISKDIVVNCFDLGLETVTESCASQASQNQELMRLVLSGARSGAGRAGDAVRRLEPRRQHLRPLHRQQRPRVLQPPPERHLSEHCHKRRKLCSGIRLGCR